MLEFFIGLFVGAAIGFVIAAVLAAARWGDDHMPEQGRHVSVRRPDPEEDDA